MEASDDFQHVAEGHRMRNHLADFTSRREGEGTAWEWNDVSVKGQRDLNCGRYCAVASIKKLYNCDEEYANDLVRIKQWNSGAYGWNPGKQGKFIFSTMGKPASPREWKASLEKYGPLIAGGNLALEFIPHYVLIIGIVMSHELSDCKFIVLDSFTPRAYGGKAYWSYERHQRKFENEVHYVNSAFINANRTQMNSERSKT